MIAPRAGRLKDRCKTEPQRNRAQRKTSKNEKHRAVTDLLGIPPANRGTERSTETLRGHDRALTDIDAAGAVEDARYKARYRNALQSRADPVKYLNGLNTPSADHIGGDDAPDRQRDACFMGFGHKTATATLAALPWLGSASSPITRGTQFWSNFTKNSRARFHHLL